MAKHEIRTEFEAWSVFVMYHNLEARDYTFAEEFGKTVGVLKANFIEICCTVAGAARSDFARLAPFIAAMYTATSREMERALKELPASKVNPEHMPLISFPWLFDRELGKIATNGNSSSLDHRPDTVLQGAAHRHAQKHTSVPPDPQPTSGLGKVETAQGITHYGELLTLDFSNTDGNINPNENIAQQSKDKKMDDLSRLLSEADMRDTQKDKETIPTTDHPVTKDETDVHIRFKRSSALDKLARFA
jgi:RNA-dependent RNA polymerase